MIVVLLVVLVFATLVNMGVAAYIIYKCLINKVGIGKSLKIITYNISQLLLCIIFYILSMKTNTHIQNIICACSILLSIVSLVPFKIMLDRVLEKKNIDEEYAFLVRKEEVNKKYFAVMNEYEQKISVMRHDFANQIESVESIMNENNQVAKEMIEELKADLESTKLHLFTNSKIVNMIITIMSNEFNDINIDLNVEALISISNKLDDIDISVLIEVMLNEALEIINLSGSRPKNVDFSIKNKEKELLLKTSFEKNTEDKKKLNKIVETHQKYYEKIIEKYNGKSFNRINDDKIEFALALNNR